MAPWTSLHNGGDDHEGKCGRINTQLDTVLIAVPDDQIGGDGSDRLHVLDKASLMLGIVHGGKAELSEGASQWTG